MRRGRIWRHAPDGSGYFTLRWTVTAAWVRVDRDAYRLLGPDHAAAFYLPRRLLASHGAPLLALSLAGPWYWAVGPLAPADDTTRPILARIAATLDPGPCPWLVPAPTIACWPEVAAALGCGEAARRPRPCAPAGPDAHAHEAARTAHEPES